MFGTVLTSKKRVRVLQLSLVACSLMLTTGLTAGAKELSNRDMNDKDSAKNSNITAAQQLNGEPDAKNKDKNKAKENDNASKIADNPAAAAKVAKKQAASTGEKTDGKGADKLGGDTTLTDAKNKQDAKKTADVVNQVPGVKVDQKDLEPPTGAPIHGFHPIKKLLRPVENLEGMSIKLEQQIMKLEGPIAGLQPPMINLQHKMDKVDQSIGTMHGQLDSMQTEVTGVRSDLAVMRKDIEALKEPIVQLKGPIGTVAKPLEKLENQLNFIILAIFVAAGAIAFGTPLAAVLIYKNRHKLFPEMMKHDELPKVTAPPPPAASGRR
jgi:septal ring factor EnvC (AmiA/AmiB activator)